MHIHSFFVDKFSRWTKVQRFRARTRPNIDPETLHLSAHRGSQNASSEEPRYR